MHGFGDKKHFQYQKNNYGNKQGSPLWEGQKLISQKKGVEKCGKNEDFQEEEGQIEEAQLLYLLLEVYPSLEKEHKAQGIAK